MKVGNIMVSPVKEFGDIAKGLSKNPLGIIALFIVLVYGIAAFVTLKAETFSPSEKIPLIYFLVFFPVMVLFVFSLLVSKHHKKLYGPGDFKNEDNFLKMQLSMAASLAAATAKTPNAQSESDVRNIVATVMKATSSNKISEDGWKKKVLWVDDSPDNNVYERQAFEAFGLSFTLAQSTNEALDVLSKQKFVIIISDMGRREGPREGYVLLDSLRQSGDQTPFFIYAGSNSQQHKQETKEHGGQGCTNNSRELFQMVTKTIGEINGGNF